MTLSLLFNVVDVKDGNFYVVVWQTTTKNATVLKYVPHVQHDYFSSFNQSDHCFLALSLLSPCLRPCLNSLINFMKQRLGADESYVDGYVKSVFHHFHGILWLLHKVKAILFT